MSQEGAQRVRFKVRRPGDKALSCDLGGKTRKTGNDRGLWSAKRKKPVSQSWGDLGVDAGQGTDRVKNFVRRSLEKSNVKCISLSMDTDMRG